MQSLGFGRVPAGATARNALLAMFAGIASIAGAHTQDGALGAPADATDYYQVSCSDDGSGVPQSLIVQVDHRGPGATPAAIVVVHRGASATTAADASGGGVGASPLVFVNGGDGVYNVFLSKSGAGTVNYSLVYHCMTGPNGTGLHAGTTIVFRQNQ